MEFYGANEMLAAAFGGSEPIETLSNWQEGECATITGKKVGKIFFQNDAGAYVAYGASGRGPRLTFLLSTNKTTEIDVTIDGKVERLDSKAIPLANLAKVFNIFAVDEDATRARNAEWLAAGADPAQLAKAPAVEVERSLARNNWQRLFVYVFNDVDAKLVNYAENKADYKTGTNMEARANRILAFIGGRELVFTKDANEDEHHVRHYYSVQYKDRSGKMVRGLKSRTYWVIKGLSEEMLNQCISDAETANLSTIFAVTRLEKDLESSEGAE